MYTYTCVQGSTIKSVVTRIASRSGPLGFFNGEDPCGLSLVGRRITKRARESEKEREKDRET